MLITEGDGLAARDSDGLSRRADAETLRRSESSARSRRETEGSAAWRLGQPRQHSHCARRWPHPAPAAQTVCSAERTIDSELETHTLKAAAMFRT